jgi:hypothetical protein
VAVGRGKKAERASEQASTGPGEVAGLSLTKEERACRCRCRCSSCSSAECRVQQRSGTVGSGHWDESAVECSAAGALARQGKGGGVEVEVSAHAFLATRALY